MNSKIEAALLACTGLTAKRNEDRQEYLKRIVRGVSEQPDDKWNALSPEAQDWFNKAADNMNSKKPLDDFPDAQAPAPAETKAEAPVARRGTTTAAPAQATTPPPAAEPAPYKASVGDTVLLTDAKGNEYQGVVKAVNDDQIELDSDDVLKWTKVKACKLLKSGAPEQASATAQAKTAEAKPAEQPKAADKPAPAKRTPPSRPTDGKPSVTQQMREVICGNIGKEKAEIAGMLKEKGVEFRDSTLDIMYADTTKTIETLKALGQLKAA